MVGRPMLSALRARGIRAALVIVALLLVLRTPSPSGTGTMLWGVQVASGPVPAQLQAVDGVTRAVGKRPSVLPINVPFENCSSRCFGYPFPAPQLNALRGYGAIPMVNWSSMSTPLSRTEPRYMLARVAGGADDTYIRWVAEAAKAWGHPFFLRFDWEMNGDWFPWAERANGNRPGDFVRAWRHVHAIFSSVGARNATWVWCPSADPHSSPAQLGGLYPGRAWVDWTCLDGYNFGALHGAQGWTSFRRVFGPAYREIERLAPHAPMMIGEVASSERGGSKAAWIADMFREIPGRFPKVRGVIWFDTPDGAADWPLQTSASSEAAFRTGIGSRQFAGNRYSRLASGPVPLP